MRCFLIGCLLPVFIATSYAATVGVAETWPGSSLNGWMSVDHLTAIPSANALSVGSSGLTMAPVVEPGSGLDPRWSFVVDASASGGIFCGSLYAVGAQALEFDIESNIPATMTIQLINDFQFIIFNAIIPLEPGSTKISASINASTFIRDMFSPPEFETLLRDTEKIWITLDWDKSMINPLFSIDNVMLQGGGPGYVSWIGGFTLPFEEGLAGADADGDGILNGHEFSVDSSPIITNLPFSVASSQNAVGWNSSSNCQYTILRSTNLLTGVFEPVRTLSGDGHAMNYHEIDDLQKAYYKVKVGRK